MTVHMSRFMLVVKAKLSAGSDQQNGTFKHFNSVLTLFKTDPTILPQTWEVFGSYGVVAND
jgi:hypothetical protein